MLKRLVLLSLVSLLWALPALARDDGPPLKMYVGGGGNYGFEMLDIDELAQEVRYTDQEIHPESSWGLQLKAGYRLNEMFTVEASFDYMHEFSWEGSTNYGGLPASASVVVAVHTYTVAIKMNPAIGTQTTFRPYVLLGGGLMVGDLDIEVHDPFRGHIVVNNVEDHPCIRAGIGLDWFITDTMSVGFEGAYFTGMQELDEIHFATANMNCCIHF